MRLRPNLSCPRNGKRTGALAGSPLVSNIHWRPPAAGKDTRVASASPDTGQRGVPRASAAPGVRTGGEAGSTVGYEGFIP